MEGHRSSSGSDSCGPPWPSLVLRVGILRSDYPTDRTTEYSLDCPAGKVAAIAIFKLHEQQDDFGLVAGRQRFPDKRRYAETAVSRPVRCF
jgi:hypothetical protein